MDAMCGVAVCLAALGGTPDGVVLDFSAKWCGPCRAMEPVVHRLQREGLPIRQIDADRQPVLLQQYGVSGLPTFVLIVRGREVERISGSVSESTLRRMLKRIPDKPDPPRPVVRGATPVASRSAEPASPARSPSRLMAGLKSLISLPAPAPRAVALEDPADGGDAVVIRANSSDQPTVPVAVDPMDACARIRVRDSQGLDVGTGTIIHSEPGRTLILTCGHLFRHFDRQGQIKVDIFGRRQQTLDGTLIRHDLDDDIGLISISPLEMLPAVAIADQPVSVREHVFSIGCGGGDTPTRLQHLVTSTTRYRGFVECTGTPIQGRSGGGLFTEAGSLAGVCVFADPAARRGLYAGLGTIRRLLDQCGLAWLCPESSEAGSQSLADASPPPFEQQPDVGTDRMRTSAEPADAGNDGSGGPVFAATSPLSTASGRKVPPGGAVTDLSDADTPGSSATSPVGEFRLEDLVPTVDDSVFPHRDEIISDQPVAMQSATAPPAVTPPTTDRIRAVASSDRSAASLESSAADHPGMPARPGIDRGLRPVVGPSVESLRDTLEAARGAEVVCIVRDRDHPETPSRIVVINRASRQFVSDLTGEVAQQIHPTSKVIPAAGRERDSGVRRYRRQHRPSAKQTGGR